MLSEHDVIAQVERMTVERLRVWVERGWVRPAATGRAVVYTEADVARVRLICDLRDTLEINEEAVPVILDLIDQIHGLRHELKCLLAAIESLPREMREAIRARMDLIDVE